MSSQTFFPRAARRCAAYSCLLALSAGLLCVPAGFGGSAQAANDLTGRPAIASSRASSGQIATVAPAETQAALVLILAEQPQHAIAREVQAKYKPTLDQYSESIRSIYRKLSPTSPIQSEYEEISFYEANLSKLTAEDRQTVASLTAEIDRTLDAMRTELQSLALREIAPSQDSVTKLVESLGGQVLERSLTVNALGVVVPTSAIETLNADLEIAEVVTDVAGKPELDVSAPSLGADDFWASSVDGGAFDVGVLDTGVDESHPALSAHFIDENYSTDNDHATGVAGIYASTDSIHRGIAYGLDGILVDNAGSISTSMAGADWMLFDAGQSPEVINYSYGNGLANTEDWSPMARYVDAVVDDCWVSWAKSAGNEGYGTTTMTVPGNNYNGITVANIDDKGTTSRTDDRIRSSSSRGPTYAGRRKPDLSAPGTGIYTTDLGGGWQSFTGTSAAAPHLGAAALLMEDSGVHDPKAIKAVLINTADAWKDSGTETDSDDAEVSGSQWNKTYGWGSLDLSHASFHRTDYFSSSVKPKGQSGAYKLYKGYAFKGDKATLVWDRRVDYTGPSEPYSYSALSDLNLRMYASSNNSLLSYDTGSIDNVHQVASTTSGDVVVKVYAWSSAFDGVSSEPFALATEEGFKAANGPVFSNATISPSTSISKGTTFTFKVKVSNTGDVPAHGVTAKVTLPGGFTLASGSTSVTLGTIKNGSYTYASWSVKTSSTMNAGTYTLKVADSSSSYGESFTKSTSHSITIN